MYPRAEARGPLGYGSSGAVCLIVCLIVETKLLARWKLAKDAKLANKPRNSPVCGSPELGQLAFLGGF